MAADALADAGGYSFGSAPAATALASASFKAKAVAWSKAGIMPASLLAYAVLALAAWAARAHPREALFGVGAAALLLLFAGIHNAWDAVIYHIATKRASVADNRRTDT